MAAHEIDQALADRKAEAGAAEHARRRRVGLRERTEQLGRDVGCDADAAVAHREHDFVMIARLRAPGHLDVHAAALGELDRVADEIGQHLAQPHRIAAHGEAHVRIDRDREAQALGFGVALHQLRDRADQLAQVEARRLQLEPLGVELGIVEDRIDDAQQLARRRMCGRKIIALIRRERRRQHELEQRQHAVQRRADFVAHRREEFALGHHRGLGGLLGQEELALRVTQRIELAAQLFGRELERHFRGRRRECRRASCLFTAAAQPQQRDRNRRRDREQHGRDPRRERRPHIERRSRACDRDDDHACDRATARRAALARRET